MKRKLTERGVDADSVGMLVLAVGAPLIGPELEMDFNGVFRE